MKINVSDIINSYRLSYKEDGEAFFHEFEEGTAGDAKLTEPVTVDIEITNDEKRFYLKGRVKGAMDLLCSRCLDYSKTPFDEAFSITLLQGYDSRYDDVHELELTHDDLLIEEFAGNEIDLSRIVYEQLALLCPINPLCSEKCKGLCQNCGTNLNEKDCGCQVDDDDHPFSALKKIK